MVEAQTRTTSSKKTKATNGAVDFTDDQRLAILNALAKDELAGKDPTATLSKKGVDDLGKVTAWKRLVTQGVLKPTRAKHPHLIKLRQVAGLKKARAVKKASGKKTKGKAKTQTRKASGKGKAKRTTRKPRQTAALDAHSIAEMVVNAFEAHDRFRDVALSCIETIDAALGE